MKIKLLKKLRRQYSLQERNGKFRVFDNKECLGGIYNQTPWIDKNSALEVQREWILKEGRKYEIAKR